jgi:hypothetical protein
LVNFLVLLLKKLLINIIIKFEKENELIPKWEDIRNNLLILFWLLISILLFIELLIWYLTFFVLLLKTPKLTVAGIL